MRTLKGSCSRPAPLWLLAIMLAAVLLAALTPSRPAAAMSAPVVTLTRIEPMIDAVVGGSGGTTILLRDPREPLELLDPDGKVWLRIDQQGAFKRGQSGSMELVRKETFYYIHDGDISRAVTDRKGQPPYPWRIAGTYGGRPFVMTGTFIPAGGAGVRPPAGGMEPESAIKWVLILLAILLAVAWSVRRRRAGGRRG